MKRGTVFLLGLACIALTASALATPMETILNPQFGETTMGQGNSAGIDGDWMILGASRTEGGGRAEIYRRDTDTGSWQWSQSLVPDAGTSFGFGWKVALSGDTAVVVQYNGSWSVPSPVYIYVRNGSDRWVRQVTLNPGDGAPNLQFGAAVDISGDTVAVGAQGYQVSNEGATYIFVRDGNGDWTEQARISAPPSDTFLDFGHRLALDGDLLVVGAPQVDTGGVEVAGAAYVFTRETDVWSDATTLTAPTLVDTGLFGLSVDISGDTICVGSFRQSPWYSPYTLDLRGSVFMRDGLGAWQFQENLDPPAIEPTGFGFYSSDVFVRVDGDTAMLVGYGLDDYATTSVLYFYGRDGGGAWSETAHPDYGTRYGLYSEPDPIGMDVSGDTAVVGLGRYSGSGAQGAAVFRSDGSGGWVQTQEFATIERAGYDYFGRAVAVAGDLLFVSAPGDTSVTSRSGIVYAYTLDSSGSSALRFSLTVPEDTDTYFSFGYPLVATTDTLVVGAQRTSGSLQTRDMFVYSNDGAGNLAFEQVLAWDGQTEYNSFGNAAAIEGDIMAVGVSALVNGGSGLVVVYRRDAHGIWSAVQDLVGPAPYAGASFGGVLALSGNLLVVGDVGDTEHYNVANGAAHIYRRGGDGIWAYEAKLTAFEPSEYAFFGYAIGVSGNTVLVGEPFADAPLTRSGLVHVFTCELGDDWQHAEAIAPLAPRTKGYFGSALAVSGSSAVVLAPGADYYTSKGRGYLLNADESGNWVEKAAFPLPESVHEIGRQIVVFADARTCAIGAREDDTQGHCAGAVYLYDVYSIVATRFSDLQTVGIVSDGNFYAVAHDFGTHQTATQLDSATSGTLTFEPRNDNWVGLYIYDYALNQWAEAMYMLLNRSE